MPHQIRLHGPWTYRAADVNGQEFSGSFRVPGTIIDASGSTPGHVQLVRLFHQPTGLESNPSLFLCGETNLKSAVIRLNETTIGESSDGHFRFPIELTSDANQIVIETQKIPIHSIRMDQIWLEIDES